MDVRPDPTGASDRMTPSGVPRAPRAGRGRRRSTTVLATVGLLASAVFAFASHELGATLHSITGLAVIAVVAWHVLAERRWVKSAVRKRLSHPEPTLVVYNTVLATTFIIANLSGVPVWVWNVGGVVAQVHTVTGILFVLLVFGHLALNGRRLASRLRRRSRATTA